jgi:hypothetical protein
MNALLKKLALSTMMAVLSTAAMAEGTEVKQSTILNASNTTGSAALAIGEKSEAAIGGVILKGGAKVGNSTILNASNTTGSAALAIGKESEATIGTVMVK